MATKPIKKVAVKTKTSTYSAVRLSMVIMTAVAMISAGVIGGALLVAALPKTQIIKNVAPVAGKSGNGAVLGQVLVRFKTGTTELARVQAVKAALVKPVNVTTLQSVKQRVGLRTVTRTVESITKKIATYKSLTPVFDSKVKLASLGFDRRLQRGTAADVQAAADTLGRWYVLQVDPSTADLGQIISSLVSQSAVEKAETNRYVQAAANPSIASSTSGNAIKLTDAQNTAYVAAGDCNQDKVVDGKDLRMLVNYMFNKGPKPTSMSAADVNRDGDIDIADLTSLISTLYTNLTAGYADLTGDGTYGDDDLNFLAAYLYLKGPAPSPLSKADYDKDGNVDISDLSMAVNVLYGPATQGVLNYGRGDANGDGKVDKRDLDFLVAYMFGKGPAPSPIGLADMDLDGSLDITDLTYLISILYEIGGVQGALVSGPGTSTGTAPVSNTDGGSIAPVIPSFLLGDSNGDGRVTTVDLHHLVAYLYLQGPVPSPVGRDDLDGDGNVDIVDVTRMVEMVYGQLRARAVAADLNADGKVNNADLKYLVAYLFERGPTPDLVKADLDGDGSVDIADVTAMVQYVYLDQAAPVCPDVRTIGSTTFLNGDVNANGSVTKVDLTALANIIYAKAALPALKERADVDCDSEVTPLDVLALDTKLNTATSPVVLPGDANSDGAVNPADLTASIETPSDVNRDGKQDILDTFDLVRLLKLNKVTKALPDLNSDGKVNWADADVVVNGVFKGGVASLGTSADVNGDGTTDAADAYAYVEALGGQQTSTNFLAGDVNADKLVDCRDVKFLHAAYFSKGPQPNPVSRGDVNGDGTANVADALLLAKRACPGLGEGDLAGDIRIALIDSGLSTVQPDLKNVLAPSKETAVNKKDDDGNGYADDVAGLNVINTSPVTVDCNGHGTALARMLAAKTGVASHSQLIPIKALDCKGRGYASGIAQALVYANVRGADIAELPLSGFGTSTLLTDVLRYTKASGMFVVGAAGNDATNISRVFPANTPGVFSVGATVASGTALTSYSNTGAVVAAPGNATGVSFQGTSVSTTYVAGTAALVLTKNPALTLAELTTKLTPKAGKINPKTVKLLDAQSAINQ